jgi:hypothetical protein
MPTVVDALVVTLSLDSKGFTAGQKQASVDLTKTKQNANAAAKEISASGAHAAQFFGKLRNEMIALGAVFLGGMGIKALAENLNTAGAAMGRMSRNLGVSSEELGAWQSVIERAGGSASEAGEIFTALQKAYQGLLRGEDAPGSQFLRRLGVTMEDMKSAPAVFKRINETINREMAAGTMTRQGAIDYMSNIPGFGPGLQNALLLPPGKLQADLAEAAALGVLHKRDTDAAEAMELAFLKTKQAVLNVSQSILTELSPQLVAILTKVNDWLGKSENREWLQKTIESATTSTKEFLTEADAVVQSLGGWVRVSEVLIGIWAVSKIGGIAAGLVGLLKLIALVPGSGVTLAAIAAASPMLSALALSGDTATDPAMNRPPSGPGWLGQGGTVERWIRDRFSRGVQVPPGAIGRNTPLRGLAPDIEAEVRAQARRHGLDEEHMVRLARREGGGYDNVSPRGAIGPMQLMPGTARDLKVDPRDWRQNVEGGTRYFQQLLTRFGGNYAAATAAYNAGPNSPGVGAYAATGRRGGLPEETQRYIDAIGTPPPRVDPSLTPRAGPAGGGITSNSHQSETHIGQIAIHTNATDAAGIARGIGPALQRYAFAGQANTGLA